MFGACSLIFVGDFFFRDVSWYGKKAFQVTLDDLCTMKTAVLKQ